MSNTAKSFPKRPSLVAGSLSTRSMLGEEAESHLVEAMEKRRARASAKVDFWDASVEGEEPLLPRVTEQGASMLDGEPKKQSSSLVSRNRLIDLVVKLKKLPGRMSPDQDSTLIQLVQGKDKAEHQQEGFEVRDVFSGVAGEERQIGETHFSQEDTDTDRLFSAAIAVDENFKQDDEMETESILTASSGYSEGVVDEEILPLTGTEGAPESPNGVSAFFGYGAASDNAEQRRRKKAARKKWRKRRKKCLKRLEKACCCLSHGSWVAEVFHPKILANALWSFLTRSWFARIGVPALIAAFVLFYCMKNPTLDFASQATASWYLVFVARQCLTLQIAIVFEYVVIEGLALRSRWVVKLLGPLVTLFVIDAKGWPFIATSWAVLDMFLLHGNNKFQQNWLYFTDISLFSPENTGGAILESQPYLRILVAMLVAGVATAIKRITVALYFGKKTVYNYKPRLDKILADIVLVSEVAQLASEAENLVDLAAKQDKVQEKVVAESRRAKVVTYTDWSKISNQLTMDSLDGESPFSNAGRKRILEQDELDSLTESEADDDDDDSNEDENEDESAFGVAGSDENVPMQKSRVSVGGYSGVTKSTTRHLKNLLDRWDEPVSRDKTADASISDILAFRKRLSYMDKNHPFSLWFGNASTRDECIKSAQRVYRRLMKLQPGASALSFDVIGALALDSDGVEDEAKKWVLQRLFRPDRFDEISLVAFVQACDSLYRRVRYFRASVGNASVIDQVLEQVINCIFYFLLVLLLLTVLQINPWSLLVSMTTLFVSFAFAVGPSASKYIEGILLIVARRPYDLGDRILIVSSDNVINHGVNFSWFVEDINLFSTTLRFAATNEVATVNNASIAMSRIVNCNRSSNALVTLTLQFVVGTTDEELSLFRDAVAKFLQDRPRIWESIVFFRCETVSQNSELKEYSLRVRHVKSWQDSQSIQMNESQLRAFCFETGTSLGINYDQPPQRSFVINSFLSAEETKAQLDMEKVGYVPIGSTVGMKEEGYNEARNLFLDVKGVKHSH